MVLVLFEKAGAGRFKAGMDNARAGFPQALGENGRAHHLRPK